MLRLSLRWVVASSLLVAGGVALAAIPAALLRLEGDLAADAMIFGGAALGGLIAALASRRRAIGEVGLGALLTLLVIAIMLVLTENNFSFDLDTAEGRAECFRRIAVYTIGALVGAAAGSRRRHRLAISNGAFWVLVSMLSVIGVVVLMMVPLVELELSSVALGLVIIAVAPSFGALAAQLMAPVRRARAIALGAGSPILFALIGDPGAVGEAIFAGLMCAGMGAVGARLALRLWPRPDRAKPPMPRAQAK